MFEQSPVNVYTQYEHMLQLCSGGGEVHSVNNTEKKIPCYKLHKAYKNISLNA